eukprot:TRINITY_DN3028_c0_g1_i5.p1 TRINITY_DN3028_c0_g1~~TRINITY_DN3028_c0_g1_i5.p1  ORF type:complete len:145 (+),score=18.56 TRINITY_DN3028_c0_g1_i5:558-992(+)
MIIPIAIMSLLLFCVTETHKYIQMKEESTESTRQEVGYLDLFLQKRLRFPTIIASFIFFTVCLCYSGPIVGLNFVGGNIYINGGLVGFAEAFGYLLSGFILVCFKRRTSFSVGFFLVSHLTVLMLMSIVQTKSIRWLLPSLHEL